VISLGVLGIVGSELALHKSTARLTQCVSVEGLMALNIP